MRTLAVLGLLCWLALAPLTAAEARAPQGVRVVDSVAAGVAGDEADHHYAGSGAVAGESGGRRWRSASGWMSYTLRIYDDSPLSIVCLVAEGDHEADAFDILVDGRKAATYVRAANQAKAGELRVNLELKETQGRTSVVVSLVPHPGARTARLVELRTVQEHLE